MLKMKKFAVMLCLVLAFTALLSGCKGKENTGGQGQNNTTSESTVPESTEPEDTTAESTEPESTSELEQPKSIIQVVDAFCKTGKFSPKGMNSKFDYEYRIPRIEDDSEDAERINKDIAENFIPLAERQLEKMKQDDWVDFLKVVWRVEKGSHSISIIIKGDNGMSYEDYVTYCYDTDSKTWLTPEKLIEAFGLSEEEYVGGFVKAARRYFSKNITKPTDEAGLAEYKRVYRSIPEYINVESIQPYIDKNDRLRGYASVAQFESGEDCRTELLTPSF